MFKLRDAAMMSMRRAIDGLSPDEIRGLSKVCPLYDIVITLLFIINNSF